MGTRRSAGSSASLRLAGRTVKNILEGPLSLDVWQRDADALVVAASEQTISELERRRLAGGERLRTIADVESGLSGSDRHGEEIGGGPDHARSIERRKGRMNLIARVTSPGPQKPLGDVLRVPLGIDVWEVKPDHLILRGTEAQLERMSSMGYLVEQLEDVAQRLSAFARGRGSGAVCHSAASLEGELRQLAEARPDIAELKEIGRSVEGPAHLSIADRGPPRGRAPDSSSWAAITRASGSRWRCPSCSRRSLSSEPRRRQSQAGSRAGKSRLP